MIEYEIPADIRKALAPRHRDVQILITYFANLGMPGTQPYVIGIPKYEGGVTVNGREICIKANSLYDDFNYNPMTVTKEEEAVVKAINRMVEEFLSDGEGVFTKYKIFTAVINDPLRDMFNLDTF